MDEMKKTRGNHTVRFENRSDFSVSGVVDVPGFDEQSVEILTEYGVMTVEGEQLRISVLDTAGGNVKLTGRIDAVFYRDEAPKKKKNGRIFG